MTNSFKLEDRKTAYNVCVYNIVAGRYKEQVCDRQ